MSIVLAIELVLIIITARLVAIALLATLQRYYSRPSKDIFYAPPLAVLIPAHNEERVITSTVRSVLASEYPAFRIIVINDGSTDGTLSELQRNFTGNPQVLIVDLPNQGKCLALNRGIELVKEEAFVTVDADTQVNRNTLRVIAAHLSDNRIGAIAGNVKVGNRINVLTLFQASEYTYHNWERRALDLINCQTIVPGAIGCWRADLVRMIGGFNGATFAEDIDLTFMIHRLGYKVAYEDSAVAYTEAPIDLCSLVRQRIRWATGDLQTVWKQRGGIGRSGLFSWIGVPNFFTSHIIVPLLDVAVPLATILVAMFQLRSNAQSVRTSAIHLLMLLFLFFLTDILGSALALMFEDQEQIILLGMVLVHRVVYRPIIAVAVLSAIWHMVRRDHLEWYALNRTATAFTSRNPRT